MGSSTYRKLTSSIFSQEHHGAEHTQRPAHTSHSRTYVRVVSSGLITRTFHQPFSKFLILSSITNNHYRACLWLLRGHIHVLYTNFFVSQQTGLWLFPNHSPTHSHQLREIRILLSIILKASITPATRVLPLLALVSMPPLRVGSPSSLARNSRHVRRSVSTSILVRCLPPFPRRLDIPSHRMFVIEF
jgi:hypothetical protein